MRSLTVSTLEYDVNMSKLLARRLHRAGSDFKIQYDDEKTLVFFVEGQESFDAFCNAVCDLLLLDLAQFEIADMVKCLPLDLSDQRTVLIEAIRYSKTAALKSGVRRAIVEHFEENDALVLEGFVRFRMKDTVQIWERCVDKAAEELLLRTEHLELMGLLGAFVRMRPARIKEVSLIIRQDGACSLTDDSDTHIDYPPDSRDSLVSLLVSLAPARITVYDLSDGLCSELLIAIHRVFEDRVRVYKTINP